MRPVVKDCDSWLKIVTSVARCRSPSSWFYFGLSINGIQEVTGSIPVSSIEFTDFFLLNSGFWLHGGWTSGDVDLETAVVLEKERQLVPARNQGRAVAQGFGNTIC